MFSGLSVSLSVCLSGRILMKFLEGRAGTKWLDFGGYLDHDPYPELKCLGGGLC